MKNKMSVVNSNAVKLAKSKHYTGVTNDNAILRVSNVSKKFVIQHNRSIKERLLNFRVSRANREPFWALKNITFELPIGSSVGLVGHNGSGKSTLLKLIGGIVRATEGEILSRGRISALIELGAGFHPDLTGRENIYLNGSILGLTKAEIRRNFDSIVDFSGIEKFIDTQVKFYSSGMYMRLAFSVSVHTDPDLLLIDEILAVGDAPFQKKCLNKVTQFKNEGRSIVMVSHVAEQIETVCDKVMVLKNGRLIYYGTTKVGLDLLRENYQ
ncbi:MAG: ABC transporter ATP-binding protein [Tropheryma whipplei]|uniref:ABC transporter ATP-binding protein n=2 Tax=Tropheryma whipplei TaxID=2039 RepID=Q83H28_TROWT|nr:ABC transporter ATP-binding protein [Tropheryma whipplei]AAO44131.1 ABC transporter ATP-binding protein [Tropheryma whipplei str. Twist]MCO8182844.1 ABC transporter ATP-binding protein [Tropheryma whipplei]CAD66728.1 putative ABC transport ATP-binding subunit [Tropheryma whipplei TW08/27]